MKKTIGTYEAADVLRADENANWSYAGSLALVEYLEGLEDSTGQEIDMDVVALRCEFSEYASLDDFRHEYFSDASQCREKIGADEGAEEDEVNELTREYIWDRGTLIEFDGGIIVSSF